MTYFANVKKDFCLDNELEKWFCKWHRKVVTGRCVIELKDINKEFIKILGADLKKEFCSGFVSLSEECFDREWNKAIKERVGAEITKPSEDRK